MQPEGSKFKSYLSRRAVTLAKLHTPKLLTSEILHFVNDLTHFMNDLTGANNHVIIIN